MIFLTVIAFVLIFSAIILVHEFGHFYAAKKSGVKVEEFGMGLPPRIWGFKKGETLYSINLIPFGGFVKMLGEVHKGFGKKIPKRSFEAQSVQKQMLIVCAGVIMNFILAFVLLTIGFVIGIEPMIASEEEFYEGIQEGVIYVEPIAIEEGAEALYLPRLIYFEDETSILGGVLEDKDVLVKVDEMEVLGEEDLYEAFGAKGLIDLTIFRDGEELLIEDVSLPASPPVVSFVELDSPAEETGLQVGDQVLMIDGIDVFVSSDITTITEYFDGSEIDYSILRDGEILELNIPLRDDGRVGIGVSDLIGGNAPLSLYLSYTPHEMIGFEKVRHGIAAPVVAVQEMWRLGKLTAVMFAQVFGGFLSMNEVPDGVAGPVGIAQMTFMNIQNGFAAVLRFVALLSLSLGVINILPIPALDGGRAVFIIYRAVTGHRANPLLEQWIHTIGFFLLILFIAYITFNDVLNLF
jgi:regulator of sigma E protease